MARVDVVPWSMAITWAGTDDLCGAELHLRLRACCGRFPPRGGGRLARGCASLEGYNASRIKQTPPPHPSPSRGEGAACRSLGVKYDNPALKGGGRRKLLARSHAAPALFGGCGLNP